MQAELRAGPGRDIVLAGEGRRDLVRCGPHRDNFRADRRDRVRGCERRDPIRFAFLLGGVVAG